MDKNLSIRKNLQLMGLFSKAHQYQPLSNRVDIFNDAVDLCISNTVDYPKLAQIRVDYPVDGDSIPDFIQLRTDKNKWDTLVDEIQNAFNPPLVKITAPYVVKLVLLNFVIYQENIIKNATVVDEADCIHSIPSDKDSDDEISLPEMASILVEMGLNNDKALKEIKRIMVNWRKRNVTSR